MRNITLLLLFTIFVNAQDVLITISGKQYKGKLVEQQATHVLFKPDNTPNSQKIPIKSIDKVRLGSGEILKFSNHILTTKSGNVYKGKFIHTTITDVMFLKDGDIALFIPGSQIAINASGV